MQMGWFAKLHARWSACKEGLYGMVRASAAWRSARRDHGLDKARAGDFRPHLIRLPPAARRLRAGLSATLRAHPTQRTSGGVLV